MKRLTLESLFVAVIAIAAVPTSHAAGSAPVTVVNTPLPVTVTNQTTPVPVTVTNSTKNFSIPPVQLTLTSQGGFVPIDPSGTQYAIGSVTVTNPTQVATSVSFRALAFAFSLGDCRAPSNEQAHAAGPVVFAPAQSTVHLTFPEPYITEAVNGTGVCLVAFGNAATDGVTWSAVGRKITP